MTVMGGGSSHHDQTAAQRRRLVGWLNTTTGAYWPLPEGHKEPEYTVSTEWERVYEGDEVVGPWSVRSAS